MKTIKCLAEFIREEMDDSEKYAKMALQCKETDKTLAEMYESLSKDEMRHADSLHDSAVRLIREYGKPAPESMQAVWNWEHNKLIDLKQRVKVLHDLYKE